MQPLRLAGPVLSAVMGLSAPAWAQGQTARPAVAPTLLKQSIRWTEAQRFEGDQRLLPGQSVEVCGPLNKDQAIEWSFYASAPLGFRVLHRVGKRTYVSEQRTRTRSLQGRLVPEESVRYCWTWSNRTDEPAAVVFMLRY